MVSLFCMYVNFPPVFTFDGKNGVESFLPFISLNNLLPFLNLRDYNSGTSFAEKRDPHLHNLCPHQLGYWDIQLQNDHIPNIYSTLHNHD